MDLSAIGQQFGLTEEQTRAAFDALTPVVASGMRRSAQSETGLQDILASALNGNRGDSFDSATTSGNDVLGQIFGSKDVSRGVAQQLSATSGIGAAVLKQLLPIVASIVMGQVAKKMGGSGTSSSGGGLGDILGEILGGGQQRQQQPQSGGGGLGDILGDILGGGQQRQTQQPQSGDGGLGDILKDVLGGGQQQQAPSGQGGSLEDMLKEILGGGAQQPSEDVVTQGRRRLDDVLGGGTRQGSDADILLDSVERSVRRR
jgi:hypothetical protein